MTVAAARGVEGLRVLGGLEDLGDGLLAVLDRRELGKEAVEEQLGLLAERLRGVAAGVGEDLGHKLGRDVGAFAVGRRLARLLQLAAPLGLGDGLLRVVLERLEVGPECCNELGGQSRRGSASWLLRRQGLQRGREVRRCCNPAPCLTYSSILSLMIFRVLLLGDGFALPCSSARSSVFSWSRPKVCLWRAAGLMVGRRRRRCR